MNLTPSTRLEEYRTLTRQGSEAFWSRLKRWFLVSALVGVLTGLGVTALEFAVAGVWGRAGSGLGPVTVVLLPTFGLLLSGLCLQFLTVNPQIHGTEEVIETFHERGGVFRFRSFPGKMLASVATLGFGGSAGLEGPSIYAGGAIGSYTLRTIRRFGFSDDDVRTLMIAGAAAGVSAIFKAPLTGIVFALEVPYRDDLTREALIPSLVAAVSSYVVLVQFLGVEPLFRLTGRYTLGTVDLLYAAILGVGVGLVARAFVTSFHAIRRYAESLSLPLWVKTTAGGLVTGLLGLAALLIIGEPVVLGTGYEAISDIIGGRYETLELLAILMLKTGAVVATLASGAAGGIFIPMIMLGATAGAFMRAVVPAAAGGLFPVVGMAAFLAAGYNTPLAAAVFVAESTGGAGYIIPGLIGSAVAFSVAGRHSVSHKQRWRRETRMDRLMRLRVADVMTHDVDTVRETDSVKDFVELKVVPTGHRCMPVLDQGGRLCGMVSLADAARIPAERWVTSCVADAMTRDVITCGRGTLVGEIVTLMTDRDIGHVPVVAGDEEHALVGIVSTSDILALDEARAAWQWRRSGPDAS
ncbi:MAG: chloride channel protein [Anaerosomatales bacterium]|nr:chloride channel protein [Anaerosomatales bacterium]